jgi:hypothetical protein
MNQGDQVQAKAEALLERQQRHQQWLRAASRSHTKNLFGLWFLLVIGICIPIFVTFLREGFSVVVPISILLILLVVLTGAYVFQEVARVHKRVDAILKLFEEAGRK